MTGNNNGAEPSTPSKFPIVGIGASAGGLEALTAFFAAMPPDTGIAFIVVTHQHVGHTSMLPELLARHTQMPIEVAETGTAVKPDRIYIAPAAGPLSLVGNELRVAEPEPQGGLHRPIDMFFRSLAAAAGHRAIGIVLSGTGTDGTLGIREIKSTSGMVMAQSDARSDGMPRSAISTGLVDYVMPVDELPRGLIEYARGPYLSTADQDPGVLADGGELMQQVFELVHAHTGHDFSAYKPSTIRRRIERRMNVHHLTSSRDYVRLLRSTPSEIDRLFKELLIGVTSMFRDPEAFEALAVRLDQLVASAATDRVLRAWVVGCSTGEEAYTVAILLREAFERAGRHLGAQVFATDLDPDAIEDARAGVYSESIAADVSPERLERYFTHEDGSYRIKKDIREMLVFAQQNVAEDPPFVRLDLVTCRNLLIYLDSKLQRRLLSLFHYALRPGGLLLLGTSESVGPLGHLFEPIDKRWKLFERLDAPPSYIVDYAPRTIHDLRAPALAPPAPRKAGDMALASITSKVLVDHLVPPTVLCHERGDIVHIHGRTGRFLEPAPGPQTTANVFNMAREGLPLQLAAAMRQAAKQPDEVQRTVCVVRDGSEMYVKLRVRRVVDPELFRGLYLVCFEEIAPAEATAATGDATAERGNAGRVAELERELQYTRESHQGTIEELETANEELKSTNEELQSTNEELQSTNEELETSKEEMQSLNEELQTVNAELQSKVEELSRLNDDMKNLLNGTNIATIFLDDDLNIKRYTETATRVVRLIPSDVGRPLADIVSRLRYDRLIEDAREVLRSLVFKEVEVQSEHGGWYLLRILPYRTTDNLIDGLVLTFVDISAVKQLQEHDRRLIRALEAAPPTVTAQSRDLTYQWATGPVMGTAVESLLGRTDADVLPAEAAERVTAAKRDAVRTGEPSRIEVTVRVDGAMRTYDIALAATRDPQRTIVGVHSVVTDITDAV